MKTLFVATGLVIGCGSGGDSTSLSAQATIHVTTEKAQSDNYVDFGEPRFVVDVLAPDGCYEPDASFGGLFRGAAMEVIQRGKTQDGRCLPTRLAISFEAVTAANETVEVHDKSTSISATFAPDVLDIRSATFGWTFQAGNTNVLGWSHPIAGTPRMSFCIPTPNGGQAGRIWNMHPTGTVSDLVIHFTLPAQLEFTGSGEAMIEVEGASGSATSCTGGECTYDLDYFVIHDAIVNP